MFITSVLTLLGLNASFICLFIEAFEHIFINVYSQYFNPLRAKLFTFLFIETFVHIFINVYIQCFNPLRAKFFLYLFVYWSTWHILK